MRTTSDGAGQPLGIVASTGATPDQAVAGLGERAWIASRARTDPRMPYASSDDLPSDLEVVSVRLAAGPGTWCAYETVCRVTGRNYWDEPGR